MKELHVLIKNEEHKQLKTKCSANDITISQLVRRWIKHYLAAGEPK